MFLFKVGKGIVVISFSFVDVGCNSHVLFGLINKIQPSFIYLAGVIWYQTKIPSLASEFRAHLLHQWRMTS